MVSLSWLNCLSGTKWRIVRRLFPILILFTLIFLILSYIKGLPGQMIISAIKQSRSRDAFPNMSHTFPPEVTIGNLTLVSDTHTLIPNNSFLLETNSSGDPPKELLIYDYIINEPDKCKDNAPFLVLLVTVERWQKEARQAIRQTWGKEDFLPGVRVLRLFVIGKDIRWNEDGQKALNEESQMFHDIIQQDYLDTYHNLTIKVTMGINWIATHCPQASYIMKTDSDMFVNTEYLVRRLLKPDEPPKVNYFTGYLMMNASPIRNLDSKWYMSPEEYPEVSYPLFCSGTGYVFSADLTPKIVKVAPTVKWIHLEDVFVGLCLDKLGVLPVAPPKVTDFNSWRVGYSDCGYNEIVTSHELRPGDIIYYWNRLQKQKHTCG